MCPLVVGGNRGNESGHTGSKDDNIVHHCNVGDATGA